MTSDINLTLLVEKVLSSLVSLPLLYVPPNYTKSKFPKKSWMEVGLPQWSHVVQVKPVWFESKKSQMV